MSKRTIKATPNIHKRTFTIRIDYENESRQTKYRTIRMNREEFASCLNNTHSDWVQFLKSDDYYVIS
jgi:hypothetical protein